MEFSTSLRFLSMLIVWLRSKYAVYMTKNAVYYCFMDMDTATLHGIWKRLAGLTAEATRMSENETLRFADNKVARLVGLLPFLAGCEEAERTALAHLAVWVVANRGGARATFDHRPADDRGPLARLAAISHFEGGDKAIVAAGLRRLALAMVSGYQKDREVDRALGAYNPLNSGVWNFEALVQELGEPSPGPARAMAAAAPTSGAGIDAALSAADAATGLWLD